MSNKRLFLSFVHIFLIIAVGFGVSPGLASIQPVFVKYHGHTHQLDLLLIAQMEKELFRKTPFDTGLIIPLNLSPSNDQSQVAHRVLGHCVNNILRGIEWNNSSMQAVASVITNSLDSQVKIVSDGGTKHDLIFRLDAATTTASVDYQSEGLIDARMAYRVVDNAYNIQVSKNLSVNSRLFFDHVAHANEVIDKVGVQWSF